MALRMFRYDDAEALGHPGEKDGVTTVSFPKSLVMYLEPAAGTRDCELLRVCFPDGSCYEYRTPVIKLTELSVRELLERHLVIFTRHPLPTLHPPPSTPHPPIDSPPIPDYTGGIIPSGGRRHENQ
jgi:hypothetical protein